MRHSKGTDKQLKIKKLQLIYHLLRIFFAELRVKSNSHAFSFETAKNEVLNRLKRRNMVYNHAFYFSKKCFDARR